MTTSRPLHEIAEVGELSWRAAAGRAAENPLSCLRERGDTALRRLPENHFDPEARGVFPRGTSIALVASLTAVDAPPAPG